MIGVSNKSEHELFVGITTWNSELFLEQCLSSIKSTTDGLSVKIGIVDNMSTDRSVEIARDFGVDVHLEHCSQAIALNRLLKSSTGEKTLLIHSDVVLLSPKWFEVCSRHLVDNCCLISPEDIGCGPLSRPYGAGMPESCFLMFDTKMADKAKTIIWRRRKGIPVPEWHLNLEHYYVTHFLPEVLARKGFTWKPMRVHASPKQSEPVYEPVFTPEYWDQELSHLLYGMGNFYSVDGEITHYHNWYDRVPKDVPADSVETTEGEGKGLPLAFLSAGTRRFLDDLEHNRVVLPTPEEMNEVREPKQVTRHVPDLSKPYA